MPNIDGAHGFLTVLLPLHTDPCKRTDGTLTSPVHAVRELLSRLPTAQHSPECAASGLQSPFARSLTTHFARFAVIDNPAFNGRPSQDAILTALNIGPDLMSEPTVDYLGRPYLLFCADFDVARDARAPFRDYLEDVWAKMKTEWSTLLAHCEGWDADKPNFVDYILSNRIETTMPFNDYPVIQTSGMPPIFLPLAISVVAGVGAGFIFHNYLAQLSGSFDWFLTILAGLLVLAAILVAGIFVAGPRSAPWSSGTDLKTVLKALHLQANFTRFVIDHQGRSPAEIQASFKDFVASMHVNNNNIVTQLPGVVPAEVR